MSTKAFVCLIVLFFALIIGSNSIYIVNEYERAVQLHLGEVKNADVKPGLHFKMPFLDTVRKFDGRILTLNADSERFMTLEKKSMQVDSYAKWKIKDVKTFYTKNNGDMESARKLLSQRINEQLRNQFTQLTLQEVISGKRDLMMTNIKDELNLYTDIALGIEVIDVRVKRIDLPDEVRGPVFQRMRAERDREAAEHRALGEKQAKITRARADREATVALAKGYRDSEKLRGEGDALAAEIYASAYNKDPEFYAFVRSLQAYRATFSQKQDVMLVDPEGDFFRYLNTSTGKK